MILKFDRPLDIQEARTVYNDTVKFITSSESYPQVSAIEFDGDPQYIFKRQLLSPKVNLQMDKLMSSYQKKIAKQWLLMMKQFRRSVENNPDRAIKAITKELDIRLSTFRDKMTSMAKQMFTRAFKLGKIRAQVMSHQEFDDTITPSNKKRIQQLLDTNEKYLVRLCDDTKTKFLKKLKDSQVKKFEDNDIQKNFDDLIFSEVFPFGGGDLVTAIAEVLLSRVISYGFELLKAKIFGEAEALKEADESEGEIEVKGGIWTLHPMEGLGGEVCEGCEANSGRWFTIDEFLDEYGQQNCLNHCRCDLRYGHQIVAP